MYALQTVCRYICLLVEAWKRKVVSLRQELLNQKLLDLSDVPSLHCALADCIKQRFGIQRFTLSRLRLLSSRATGRAFVWPSSTSARPSLGDRNLALKDRRSGMGGTGFGRGVVALRKMWSRCWANLKCSIILLWMCSEEFMARPLDSTLTNSLPVLKTHSAWGYTWGLFQGRSNTHVPWNTWLSTDALLHWMIYVRFTPFNLTDLIAYGWNWGCKGRLKRNLQLWCPEDIGKDDPWFHDVFHSNGTAYDAEELKSVWWHTTGSTFRI